MSDTENTNIALETLDNLKKANQEYTELLQLVLQGILGDIVVEDKSFDIKLRFTNIISESDPMGDIVTANVFFTLNGDKLHCSIKKDKLGLHSRGKLDMFMNEILDVIMAEYKKKISLSLFNQDVEGLARIIQSRI